VTLKSGSKGHSRSSEPTRIDQAPMTSYQRSVMVIVKFQTN